MSGLSSMVNDLLISLMILSSIKRPKIIFTLNSYEIKPVSVQLLCCCDKNKQNLPLKTLMTTNYESSLRFPLLGIFLY